MYICHKEYWYVISFSCNISLSVIDMRVVMASWYKLGNVPPVFWFWVSFLFLLKCLIEFIIKTGHIVLSLGNVFDYEFNFFNNYGRYLDFLFLLMSLLISHTFSISLFHLNCHIYWHKVVLMPPYDPFDVHRVSSGTSFYSWCWQFMFLFFCHGQSSYGSIDFINLSKSELILSVFFLVQLSDIYLFSHITNHGLLLVNFHNYEWLHLPFPQENGTVEWLASSENSSLWSVLQLLASQPHEPSLRWPTNCKFWWTTGYIRHINIY